MGQHEILDPALAFNRRAQTEGWPARCDSTLCFNRPELNAVRDIWHARAVGNAVPSRTAFDARSLKPFLPNITIIERVFVDATKWRYRTRLAGTAIVEVLGENTGKFFDAHTPRELLTGWTRVCDIVLDTAAPIRFSFDIQQPRISYLSGESLIAPIADKHDAISLILVCAYFHPKRPDAEA